MLYDCCEHTNTCRDWAFSNSGLEVGLPAFQLTQKAWRAALDRCKSMRAVSFVLLFFSVFPQYVLRLVFCCLSVVSLPFGMWIGEAFAGLGLHACESGSAHEVLFDEPQQPWVRENKIDPPWRVSCLWRHDMPKVNSIIVVSCRLCNIWMLRKTRVIYLWSRIDKAIFHGSCHVFWFDWRLHLIMVGDGILSPICFP